jgi:putative phosphoribosyl transferase
MRFATRSEAGGLLARRLVKLRGADLVVLGLSPGGMAVACQVAAQLGCPVDAWFSIPLYASGHAELSVGALSEEDSVVMDQRLLHLLGLGDAEVMEAAESASTELARRVRLYRPERAAPRLRGRTVVLVDDAVSSACVVRAAVRAIRRHEPTGIVLAAAVARASELEQLPGEVDRIVCLSSVTWLGDPKAWFDEPAPGDDQAAALLALCPQGAVQAALPGRAGALVLLCDEFRAPVASERLERIARALHSHGLATLIPPALRSPDGEADDVHARVDTLAGQLVDAIDRCGGAPVFLLGMDLGAAAVLRAAAARQPQVLAVVCAAGRLDLAEEVLVRIQTPALLIAGAADELISELARRALDTLQGPRELTVIGAAGHAFDEPGALEEVGRLTAEWFSRFQSRAADSAPQATQ